MPGRFLFDKLNVSHWLPALLAAIVSFMVESFSIGPGFDPGQADNVYLMILANYLG